jgi:hypothetical protein
MDFMRNVRVAKDKMRQYYRTNIVPFCRQHGLPIPPVPEGYACRIQVRMAEPKIEISLTTVKIFEWDDPNTPVVETGLFINDSMLALQTLGYYGDSVTLHDNINDTLQHVLEVKRTAENQLPMILNQLGQYMQGNQYSQEQERQVPERPQSPPSPRDAPLPVVPGVLPTSVINPPYGFISPYQRRPVPEMATESPPTPRNRSLQPIPTAQEIQRQERRQRQRQAAERREAENRFNTDPEVRQFRQRLQRDDIQLPERRLTREQRVEIRERELQFDQMMESTRQGVEQQERQQQQATDVASRLEEQAREIRRLSRSGVTNKKLNEVNRRFNLSTNVPQEFKCPITLEIMEDPVILSDGQTFERSAITQWFQSNGYSSPITRQRVSHQLIPNYALKNRIQDWMEGFNQDMEGGGFDF